MLSETNQSNKDQYYITPLSVCRVVKFIEIKENDDPGTGESGRDTSLICVAFQFGELKNSGGGQWGELHSRVNVLNATELDI